MPSYFADTYALVEYFKGSKIYEKYIEENKITTSRLNLMELYYWTLKDHNEELAENYFESLVTSIVEFDDATIKRAMKFRLGNKRKNISYIDAIGYQVAFENGVKFLTGDKSFEGLQNVEYVK